MKRIVSALLIAGALLSSSAQAALKQEEKLQRVEKQIKQVEKQLERLKKEEKQLKEKEEEGTKYICTIGLEGEGSFTEVYKDRKECKRLCKGGATICEKTGIETSVNLENVD